MLNEYDKRAAVMRPFKLYHITPHYGFEKRVTVYAVVDQRQDYLRILRGIKVITVVKKMTDFVN